jgi:hypothetical protein
MRITLIVLLVVMGCAACLAACNNNSGSMAPSTMAVDSALRAAPDTIKAGSLDSVVRKGPGDTVK